MNPKTSFFVVILIALTLLQAVVFAQSSAKEINNNISKIESYPYQNPTQPYLKALETVNAPDYKDQKTGLTPSLVGEFS
jgi:hypothetical protein